MPTSGHRLKKHHAEVSAGGPNGAKAKDFFALMKPRVMSLAVFTAFVGMIRAPVSLSPDTMAVAMLAIALGAGGAGALNMWYETETDAVMKRTSGRPIPGGRLSRPEALAFGLIVSALSVAVLALSSNGLAAALLAFTIFFYAVIYTMWLKPSTPQNIVIGGAAGALPPMIGWAAASGTVGLESVLLFLIIFLWTPPHFWALALYKADDYGAAGIPMMPNVKGAASTRKQIFLYSILLVAVGILPWVLGLASAIYGAASAVLGALFLWRAWKVLRKDRDDQSMRPEKRLFGFSIFYLFLIFATLLFDEKLSQVFAL
jgi:protoheme IX farnesyltransferase